jgi:hypothetical protein
MATIQFLGCMSLKAAAPGTRVWVTRKNLFFKKILEGTSGVELCGQWEPARILQTNNSRQQLAWNNRYKFNFLNGLRLQTRA